MRWERGLAILTNFAGWVLLLKSAGWPDILSWEMLGIIAGTLLIVLGGLLNWVILQERRAMAAREAKL